MPYKDMKDKTGITVSKKTRDRLKERGAKGETYDSIINDLLDKVRK